MHVRRAMDVCCPPSYITWLGSGECTLLFMKPAAVTETVAACFCLVYHLSSLPSGLSHECFDQKAVSPVQGPSGVGQESTARMQEAVASTAASYSLQNAAAAPDITSSPIPAIPAM